MNNFSFNTGAQIAQEIRDNSAVYPFSITTEQFVAAMQSPVQLTGWPAEMGAQITTVSLTLIQEADPEQGITEDSVLGVVPLAPESSLVADPETGAPVNKIVWKGGLGMQEGGTDLEYKVAIDGGYLSVETSFGPDAANVPEWEANQSYLMNQCVKHENVVYMALSNVTDAVWTPSHWSDPMLSPYNVSGPATLNLILYMAPKMSYTYQHLYELLESARLWFTNDNTKGQQFYTGYNVDHHVYTVVATESDNRRFTFWGGDFGNAVYDSTSQTWQIETFKSLSGLGYAKYNQAQAYAVGDIVAKAGGYRDGLYRCKAAVAANEAWDDQKWDEITTAGQIAELVSDMSSVAALAEGRTKSYVVNALTDITYSSESADGDLLGVTAITGATLSEMKVGDVVYIKDVNVPDYWVSAVASGSLTLSKMETKLTGYVTGTGLTANKIITGNGGSAVQSSGIGISTAKPASADDANVPTVGAVYAGLQDKQDNLISGTNIKTIDGRSVLGAGDLESVEAITMPTATGTLDSATLAKILAYPQRFVLVFGGDAYRFGADNGTILLYCVYTCYDASSMSVEMIRFVINKSTGVYYRESVVSHDNTKEDVSNKTISLSGSSTDTQYPSAKATYDADSAIYSKLFSLLAKEEYNSSHTYYEGDICMKDGKLYELMYGAGVTGAWDDTKWSEVTMSSIGHFVGMARIYTTSSGGYPPIVTYHLELSHEPSTKSWSGWFVGRSDASLMYVYKVNVNKYYVQVYTTSIGDEPWLKCRVQVFDGNKTTTTSYTERYILKRYFSGSDEWDTTPTAGSTKPVTSGGIKTYVDGESVKMIETTWADLKALRDGGNLVPGMQYRITDYQCTTATANTSSAGHQFDIIVVADSESVLNENARAALHAGDAYFANNDLAAWELKYCLDNDTTRFAWADTTNGKGVIYRMVDEFGNDVPYDFKNIQFKGKAFAKLKESTTYYEASMTRLESSDTTIDGVSYYAFSFNVTGGPSYPAETYYTKSLTDMSTWYAISNGVATVTTNVVVAANPNITIGSFYYTFTNGSSDVSKTGLTDKVYSNVIGEYRNSNGNAVQLLNANIFISSGGSLNCYCNKIGSGNHDNAVSYGFFCNAIGPEFHSNVIDYYFGNNTIGSGFYKNSIKDSFRNNTIGYGFIYNTVGSYFRNNSIGSNFYYNSIGSYFQYNSIDPSFENNTVGSSASESVYVRYCKFDEGVSYISLTSDDASASSSNQIQNVHIHAGVKGSSTYNRLTISVPDRNLAYSTDYYMSNSQEVYL